MKLSDLLLALASNSNLTITLLDSSDKELITFKISGYESIESELNDRIVKRIKIFSPSYSTSGLTFMISVEDAVTNEESTEP